MSLVPEFGNNEDERNNASHMGDGGIEAVPTVDAGDPGSEWCPSVRSSSGPGSTPEAGSHHGPAKGTSIEAPTYVILNLLM